MKKQNNKEIIEKTHFGRNQITKCGIEKRSQKRYGSNFGYSITDKISEVTCELCLRRLQKLKGEIKNESI